MGMMGAMETPQPTSDLTLVPIAPKRAFEEIAAQLRALILAGKLKPGDRLPAERDLAARFNVARSTLREALRALELGGIVELRKGATGGAFIRPGGSDVVAKGLLDLYFLGAISPEQLTQARIGMSELVVRAACERITDEQLAELDANVAAAIEADRVGGFDERTRVHQQFHLLLARTTGNPILIANMEGIMEIVRLFVASIGPGDNAYVLPSRRRLLAQLRARDAQAATAEMVDLLRRLHQEYMVRWNQREKGQT